MNRQEYVNNIIKNVSWSFTNEQAIAIAPSNIAIAKYWGKRNIKLNLPVTDSLSISLGEWGAKTKVSNSNTGADIIYLNNNKLDIENKFCTRLIQFLNLFRPSEDYFFKVETNVNFPVAAGFASSAAGFAALTMALDKLFSWNLPEKELSMLARIGSGSAARSIWHGFVHWHAGTSDDGLDCFAEKLAVDWPEFKVGMLVVDSNQKLYSSTYAMNVTTNSSVLYNSWPNACEIAIDNITRALSSRDFIKLGKYAEQNSMAMHATMLAAMPAIHYSTPETLKLMRKVWALRDSGHNVYFTQDAGPNLKLLFLESEQKYLQQVFPQMHVINPFAVKESNS